MKSDRNMYQDEQLFKISGLSANHFIYIMDYTTLCFKQLYLQAQGRKTYLLLTVCICYRGNHQHQQEQTSFKDTDRIALCCSVTARETTHRSSTFLYSLAGIPVSLIIRLWSQQKPTIYWPTSSLQLTNLITSTLCR